MPETPKAEQPDEALDAQVSTEVSEQAPLDVAPTPGIPDDLILDAELVPDPAPSAPAASAASDGYGTDAQDGVRSVQETPLGVAPEPNVFDGYTADGTPTLAYVRGKIASALGAQVLFEQSPTAASEHIRQEELKEAAAAKLAELRAALGGHQG